MSFDGERSPKRQRLESYSPASPPMIPDTKAFFIPPQTPPPSVRMSPSWQSQSLSNQQQQATSGTFPTPPSTAGFQSQMSGRGAGSESGGESENQTPATEYESGARKDGEGDAEMMDRQDGGERDLSMVDAEHRRTDHERQGSGRDTAAALASIPGAQSLYKLSTAPIAPSRPHPSQDVIQLYGLQRIQASVARHDPVTGEKINKLRKSYEGKLKTLGLEGRNKASANQNELQGLLDPMWNFQTGNGGTVWDEQRESDGRALSDPEAVRSIFSKLDAALDFEAGRLPMAEHKELEAMLGLDDVSAGGRTPAPGLPGVAPSAVARTAPALAGRSSAPSSPRNGAARPERANKKRRYDDGSFEGYTGFEDDGYSTGGVDDTNRRGSGAKRQKRKDFGPSAQNSPSFTTGANSNMVGVRP